MEVYFLQLVGITSYTQLRIFIR